MGGMIITGFYGNPLNFLVRGQLGLQYHCLRPETTLYDSTGFPVDIKSDQLVEHLFNDSLDRVSEYKFDIKVPPLVVGNVQFISEGRDSSSDGGWTLKQIDDAGNIESPPLLQRQLVSDEIRSVGDLSKYGCASIKARGMGWPLKSGIETATTINLDAAAHAEKACMGSVFEEAINQYTQILDLNPLHFRLLNWHVANLEYSNATDLHNLSLGGWDIDAGNEWEGKHTMVIGGYQSVARGLLMCPQPLECRFNSPVQKIVYDPEAASTGHDQKCAVICEDGTTIDADYVVCSIPLGVLKAGNVCFDPPLPEWKKGAIKRIGYGVLNKVILTYQEAFWETDRDIFGILRDPLNPESVSQEEYAESRGRFFQWFNVSSSSGLPCLLALMAGKAGYAAEKEDDKSLVQEATTLLRKVFGKHVPYPKEAIITRWASDKYSFGSYSSCGPEMEWDDYDTLAKPLGNLFFAGEHTIGTHPATVHGAYISGLRAASEVFDSLLGPLQVPEPLFPAKQASGSSLKRKATTLQDFEKQLRHQHEQHFQEFVVAKLGPALVHPKPPPSNVYSFFRRENTTVIRQRCLSRRHYPKGKIPPKDMSQMASKMWRELSPDERSLCEKRYQTVIVEYKNLINDLPRAEMTRQSQVAELREQFDKLFPLKGPHQQNQKDISVKPAGTHKSERHKSETDQPAVVGIALQEVRDPVFIDTESGTIRLSGLPARKTKVVSYVEDDSDLEGL
ncbi:flavin containing amine oxidoreductase [Ceratocystis lukuohia]|uniref:Flavin containing amine oxidoreductase n=1 Tax=Ceratocystis lukuohia TaxID=2019550 RepID=A0ABR4MPK0_9PEZI